MVSSFAGETRYNEGDAHIIRYRELRRRLRIDEHAVLLEQQNGRSASGNITYIAKELCGNDAYRDLNLFISVDGRKAQQVIGEFKSFAISADFVERGSEDYYRLLASAKYLICDNGFPPEFAKRPGQVLVNTWHGTPLKTLGRRIPGETHLIGNVEKNLLTATYLLAPNDHTARVFLDDYMTREFGAGSILMLGYPRNTPFCMPRDLSIRGRYATESQHAYAYLPTFRSTNADGSKKGDDMQSLLHDIDALLSDDEQLYVRLHPSVASEMDFERFRHICAFPEGVEAYEFLNICDVLATDYSSVMFDYALTRNKVVLFTYDEDTYIQTRGTYFPLDDLPFPRTHDVVSFVDELRSEKAYDDTELLERFCAYDSKDATSRLCEHIFRENRKPIEERPFRCADVKRTLVYISDKGFTKGRVQKAFSTAEERFAGEAVLFLIPWPFIKTYPWLLESLPEGASFLPTSSHPVYTEREARYESMEDSIITKPLKRLAAKSFRDFELARLLGDMQFDAFAHIANGRVYEGLPRWL